MSDDPSGADLANAVNAATVAPTLAPAESVVQAAPETPAPEATAAPPVPELEKVGSPKSATFVCVRRARAAEYTDFIHQRLLEQFLVPAAPAVASPFRLGDVSLFAFSFPTNPGAIEYDALTAYLAKAMEAAS